MLAPSNDPDDNETGPSSKRLLSEDESMDISEDETEETLDMTSDSATRLGSSDFFDNSGMMLLAILALSAVVILLLLLMVVIRRSPKVNAVIVKVLNKILFNAVIRYFLQGTLKMQIAAVTVIALSADKGAPPTGSLVTLIVFNVAPFVFTVVLCRKRSTLRL